MGNKKAPAKKAAAKMLTAARKTQQLRRSRPHPRPARRRLQGCEAAPKMRCPTDVAIEIIGMNKWYGDFHVLRDINLKVMRGERIVIAGRRARASRRMIRCINRLEEHQKGKIIVDGIELTNDLKKIDEIRREVGMVFQHFNLFPHLTILENCTLAPIWVRKMPKKEAEERAMHFLERVKIPEQATSIPASCRAVSSSAWPSRARCA
jgi:general L-amino acid transport system ATP-binding protein